MIDLKQGKFVLVYDSEKREGETDFVIAAEFVTPTSIQTMRTEGGGLIFLMIPHLIAQRFQLPFLADIYTDINSSYPVLKALDPNDIPYDTKSSFSVYINHRQTFTGITDNDRSLTVRKFAKLIQNTEAMSTTNALDALGTEFRSPGHVPICIASPNLLHERKGHTELVIALLQMAGVTPAGSGCEMMGNNGLALSKEDAQSFAHKHHLTFVEGKDIISTWKTWQK